MTEQVIKTPDGFNQALSEAAELKGTKFQRAEHTARQRLGTVLNAIPDDCFRGGAASERFYSRLDVLEDRALEEHVSTEEDIDRLRYRPLGDLITLAIAGPYYLDSGVDPEPTDFSTIAMRTMGRELREIVLDETLCGRAVNDELIYKFAIRMLATAELAQRLADARKNVPRTEPMTSEPKEGGEAHG